MPLSIGLAPIGGRGAKAPARLPPTKIPGLRPPTPQINGPSPRVAGPFRSQSTNPKVNPAVAQHAATRQREVVTNYISHLYGGKLERDIQRLPTQQLETHLRQASDTLAAERDRLLNHPAVQGANAEGKIVPQKGLKTLDSFARQVNAIEGPHGVAHSKQFGLVPRSLRIGIKGERELATRPGVAEGSVGRTLAKGESIVHARSEPSTLESLGYASIGIPGIGIGGDIAKLAEMGAQAAPKVLAEGGIKQLASSAATKAAAKGAAIKSIPGDIADVLRSAPEALRSAPSALRAAGRELPSATKAALKGAPGATARYGARAGESTVHSVGGLAAMSAAHKAGFDLPGQPFQRASAFLGGTGRALEHNPWGTLKTTGRSIPGLITAPAALAISVPEAAIEGSPKPITSTASRLASGTGEIIGELASGNPKTVQGSVEHKAGLTPFVPVPALLAKLHGSELYMGPRGAIRRGVESRREAARAEARAPQGRGFHATKETKPSVPVPGRPGEFFVSRRLGSAVRAREAHQAVSLDTERAASRSATEKKMIEKQIIGAAHGRTGQLPGLARKMGDEGRAWEGLVGPMAKYGVPHQQFGKYTPHEIAKALEEYYGPSKEAPIPNALTDRMAVQEAVDHPAVFSDQRHQAMTEAFRNLQREGTAMRGRNDVAPHRVQNDFTNWLGRKEGLAPVLKDYERIPKKALQHTSPEEAAKALQAKAADLRAQAQKQTDSAKAEGLTGQANALDQHATDLVNGQMVSREGAWAHYDALKAEAKTLRREGRHAEARPVEQQAKGLYGAINGLRHPDTINDRSTSKKPVSTGPMKNEFRQEQNARAQHLGMVEPVHVSDTSPPLPGGSMSVERAFPAARTHFKAGTLSRTGEANARFESVLEHSTFGARTRLAMNELIHNTVQERKMAVLVRGEWKHVLTPEEERWAKTHGTWPANAVGMDQSLAKQSILGAHALDAEGINNIIEVATHGPDAPAALRALEEAHPDIKDELKAAESLKGRKVIAVEQPAIQELKDQFANPRHPNWRKAANVPSRIVLNDPAWVFSQLLAKSLPIAAALGPDLVRAPFVVKTMADIQKKPIHDQAAIISMVGSSAGVRGTGLSTFHAGDPYSKIRAISKSPTGRVLSKLADGTMPSGRELRHMARYSVVGKSLSGDYMGRLDRWSEAQVRMMTAAIRADKGFRNWYGGFKGLNADMRKVAEATKGMGTTERLTYISKHPELARALQKDINRYGGNWNSFTALEKKIQPFAMFYPWIRYSIDWVFHVFPINHPVAATMLAMLAQVNSNDLQRLAAVQAAERGEKGVTPTTPLGDPLAYSYPMTGEKNVFPVGPRISPSLGVLGTTVTSGKPISLLGGLNMPIATAISTITGTNLLSGEKFRGSRGDELLNQVFTASPLVRFLEHAGGFRGFGKGPQSALSRAYELVNPQKTERSVLTAYTPQSAKQFGLEDALDRLNNIISNNSSEKQKEIAYDTSISEAARAAKIAPMETAEKEALAAREKLFEQIGGKALAKQAKIEYEGAKRAEAMAREKNSFKNAFSSAFSGGGFNFGSAFGGGGKNYTPPGKPNTFSLPGVSLGKVTGAIGNFLGSFIGGTAAQAAELPKGQKAEQHKAISISGPLTPSQKAFGAELARQTGLSPKTVGGWLLAEESGSAAQSKEAKGDANWLNIGPGQNLGSNPVQAARATAQLINSGNLYQGIRNARGKGVAAEVAAIRQSPWDAGHYANGIPTNLVSAAPQKVATRFRAGIVAAHELAVAHLPYVWGGGHGAPNSEPTGGGLDCSGTVSYVLNKMGVLKGSLTSGEMGSVLKPGPGAITVFYNPTHTFMRIGDRYFGTSQTNAGGGPGFFSPALGEQMAKSGQYSVGHVAGLGQKQALQLGIPMPSGGFPGMTISPNGTTATISSGAQQSTPGFSTKPITASQRLARSQRATGGLAALPPVKASSASHLASALKAVGSARTKLENVKTGSVKAPTPPKLPGFKPPLPVGRAPAGPKFKPVKVPKGTRTTTPRIAGGSAGHVMALPKPKKAKVPGLV